MSGANVAVISRRSRLVFTPNRHHSWKEFSWLVFCVRSLHMAKLSDRSKSIRRMIRQFRRSREASSEIIQTNQEKACVRQPSLANCSYRDGQRVEISRTDLQPRGHRIDPTVDRRES